jgi:hypothetical protein
LAKNTERYHRYFRVLVFSYTEVVHGKEWIMRFLPKGDPRLYLLDKCQEHGLDFDECNRNRFRRKLDVQKFISEKIAAAA